MLYSVLTTSKSRSLKLSVAPDGSVVVTKPRLIPDFMVKRFVEKNQDWILKQQAKRRQQQPLVTADKVLIFGQWYERSLGESSRSRQTLAGAYYLDGDKAVYVPISGLQLPTSPVLNKSLDRFIKSAAQNFIQPRLADWASKMNITYHGVTFRQQKTRWGSCSSQGNLNFNWRLAHFNPAVIEYVLIHELAHRVHMNHSTNFWRLVAQFDHEYKQHQRVLKKAALNID